LARLRHDETEVEPQHAVKGAPVRRQMLARLEDGEHHRDEAGNLLTGRPGLRTERDIGVRLEAVAGEQEGLPAAVLADGRDVGGDLVEAGQVVLAREHALEFGADGRIVGFDRRRPREYGLVIDRRIADTAQAHVEALGAGHDGHEDARDQARSAHRLDAVGGETLHPGLGGSHLLLCNGIHGLPSRNAPAPLLSRDCSNETTAPKVAPAAVDHAAGGIACGRDGRYSPADSKATGRCRMRPFVLLFTLLALVTALPAGAADVTVRPAALTTQQTLPFPRSERAQSVWASGVCGTQCGAYCAQGLVGCLSR